MINHIGKIELVTVDAYYLANERMDALQIFWDESIWIKINKTVSSICLEYFIIRRRLINLFSNT